MEHRPSAGDEDILGAQPVFQSLVGLDQVAGFLPPMLVESGEMPPPTRAWNADGLHIGTQRGQRSGHLGLFQIPGLGVGRIHDGIAQRA